MDASNDNQKDVLPPSTADVLPPEFRELLDQCDRVGIGMDVVMNVLRTRLYDAGFERTGRTEMMLTAFRKVIERYR